MRWEHGRRSDNIEDRRNTIMITGYNAEYTLGRRIVERERTVKIFGEEFALNAEVVVLNSLSAHADRDELLSYHRLFNPARLQHSFIVHGDLDQGQKLQSAMQEELGLTNIEIPSPGASYQL